MKESLSPISVIPMLEITQLNAYYGESHVLKDVFMRVEKGRVAIIVGPNGHGKSTLLKAICGLIDQVDGQVSWDGEDITHLGTAKIVNVGITYIAENRELFPHMSVRDNLKLGAYSKRARANEKKNMEWVASLFPKLIERRNQLASTMSGGEAKMLAIARGLMSDAEVLCIDEPALGLQPSYRTDIFRIISEMHRQGKTVLIVEQNIPQLFEMADRIYVMDEGCLSFKGGKDEALNDDQLKEILFGM